MERNLRITPQEPSWKKDLMNSPVLSAKPDEKGYLSSYLDGIYPGGRKAMMPGGKFYNMFDEGKGGELKPSNVAGNNRPPNACAVHSSSMLAYNFFHWVSPEHPLHFSDEKTYDKVYFEVKIPVLKTSRQAPANLDVMLLSDDCHSMLCFESKLSEYTKYDQKTFAESYTKRESYYNNHFEDDFIKYTKTYQNVDRAYNKGVVQNVRHLIAITNLHQSNFAMADMLALNNFIEPKVAQKMMESPLSIKFANLMYILKDESGDVPNKKAMQYIKLLANFRATASFSDDIWQYFVLPNFVYYYNDMFAIMRSQMPDGLVDYLESRYPHLRAWNDETYPIHRIG